MVWLLCIVGLSWKLLDIFLPGSMLYKCMCYEYVVAFEVEVIIGPFEISDN